jgi:hypothetical protein
MLLVSLALMAALAAAEPPATAPAATTPAPTEAAPAKPDPKTDPKRIICEETPSIGSVIPQRVCRTRAEWDRRARDDQHQIRDFQDNRGNSN